MNRARNSAEQMKFQKNMRNNAQNWKINVLEARGNQALNNEARRIRYQYQAQKPKLDALNAEVWDRLERDILIRLDQREKERREGRTGIAERAREAKEEIQKSNANEEKKTASLNRLNQQIKNRYLKLNEEIDEKIKQNAKNAELARLELKRKLRARQQAFQAKTNAKTFQLGVRKAQLKKTKEERQLFEKRRNILGSIQDQQTAKRLDGAIQTYERRGQIANMKPITNIARAKAVSNKSNKLSEAAIGTNQAIDPRVQIYREVTEQRRAAR